MDKQFCPRCGQENPLDRVVCIACSWLLSNEQVPKQLGKSHVSLDKQKGGEEENHPSDGHSYADIHENASQRPESGHFSKPAKKSWDRLTVGGYAISGLAVMAALVIGWRVHASPPPPVYHYATTSSSQTASTAPSHQPSTSTSSSTAATVSSVHTTTHTTPSSSTSVSSSPSPGVKLFHAVWLIQGKVVNNQLITTLWASATPNGPRQSIQVMIDTGSTSTLLSSPTWKSLGGQTTGGSQQIHGIGGSETVSIWKNVYVYPTQSPGEPAVINGATLSGGLGRTVTGQEGISMLIGEDVLKHGVFHQNKNTWSLRMPTTPPNGL